MDTQEQNSERSLARQFFTCKVKTIETDRIFEDFCNRNEINMIRFNDVNFGRWLFKKQPLQPHFVSGKSDQIDLFMKKVNEYLKKHDLGTIV